MTPDKHRVLNCRSGEVFGSTPVYVPEGINVSRVKDFTFTCPQTGCLAWVIIDKLMSTGQEQTARCTQRFCHLNGFYQREE